MIVLSSLFYTVTIAALLFFAHKVLWLVQYRRVQGKLVERAVRSLTSGDARETREWDEFTRACWTNQTGEPTVTDPIEFTAGIEEGLEKFRAEIRASRRSIETTLVKALASGDGQREPMEGLVLSLRRLSPRAKDRMQVTLDLSFSPVAMPPPPDKKLYELNVRSRYGFWRRALVFFSGAADVVYSSQHVARMSQNAHVPLSVLVRRLSLVFLIIGAVLLDWTFGARRFIELQYIDWLGLHPGVGAAFVDENLGAALAFVTWLGLYGSVYLAAYFTIRRRYQSSMRRLRSLAAREPEALASIRKRQLDELLRWAREYARALDGSVEITLRHADTLVDHCAHRARHRVSSRALLEGARKVSDALFEQLPESHGGLEDVATTQKHTLSHYVWPREEEMEYQIRLTQIRAAWQHLELGTAELRRERPDPKQAHALWRAAVGYATTFEKVVPEGIAQELRRAYRDMVRDCVEGAEKDLDELDARLLGLAKSLNDQLASARPLVESKVELANEQIRGAVAALSAEIISVREQARLEAMAFEI